MLGFRPAAGPPGNSDHVGAAPPPDRRPEGETGSERFSIQPDMQQYVVGSVGTGKTHLSIALGMACCQHNYRVRFVTAAELVTLLVEAQQQGRLARKLQLARYDAVIVDELGYVPLDKAGADLLFGFISQRYERRSLVVTTNLPFARWSEVFLDPTAAAAVIDRIVHHATVLQTSGGSYRLEAAKQNQALASGKEGTR